MSAYIVRITREHGPDITYGLYSCEEAAVHAMENDTGIAADCAEDCLECVVEEVQS